MQENCLNASEFSTKMSVRIGSVGREWQGGEQGPERCQGEIADRALSVLTHGPRLAGLTCSLELRKLFVDISKGQALFDLRDLDFKFLRKDRFDCRLLHDFS